MCTLSELPLVRTWELEVLPWQPYLMAPLSGFFGLCTLPYSRIQHKKGLEVAHVRMLWQAVGWTKEKLPGCCKSLISCESIGAWGVALATGPGFCISWQLSWESLYVSLSVPSFSDIAKLGLCLVTQALRNRNSSKAFASGTGDGGHRVYLYIRWQVVYQMLCK